MLLLVSTLLALTAYGSNEKDTVSLALSFETWYENNSEIFQPGNPYFIVDIPNPLCALMTDSVSISCNECSSKLQQWYLSRKCMASCHDHNCAPYYYLVVECTFSPDNFINVTTEELKWGANCTCPANTVHAGEEIAIPDTPYKEMLHEWQTNRCFDPNAVGRAGVVDCDPFACTTSNITWCDINAVCTTNHSSLQGFTCGCHAGFTGDGFNCVKIVKCASLPSIQNGKYVTGDGIDASGEYLKGTTLSVECDAGYGIIGDSTVECVAEDTWTHSTLSCVKCSTIPTIQNGIFETSDGTEASGEYPGGTKLLAKCNSGFVLVSSNGPAIVCQSSDTWNPNTKICACSDDSSCQADAGCDYYYDHQICTDYCETGSKIGECWCDSDAECGNNYNCIDNRCTGVCIDDSSCRGGLGCDFLYDPQICTDYCQTGSKWWGCWCASDSECDSNDCYNNRC